MVYRLVNSTYNVKEMILRLTRLLCQFIKASSASVYILDAKKQKIEKIAIFDNKINIFLDKKKDLDVSPEEMRVAQGYVVFKKHLIGLPLVADDNIGAIFVRRKRGEPAFTEFDKEMLSVVTEQVVTAIRNLQLYEEQQKVILGSIDFIGKMLKRFGHSKASSGTSIYFKIVKSLGEKLRMGQEEINNLYYASVLKDAGAMDVPFEILSKSSKLTPEEFKILHSQPIKSVELIRPVGFLKPVLPLLLHHHEKYDGSGYPSGLKKDQIPLGARLMAVVEAFEAMILERPYKKRKLTIAEALRELNEHSGSQFDPDVVKAFVELAKTKKFRNYLSSIKD